MGCKLPFVCLASVTQHRSKICTLSSVKLASAVQGFQAVLICHGLSLVMARRHLPLLPSPPSHLASRAIGSIGSTWCLSQKTVQTTVPAAGRMPRASSMKISDSLISGVQVLQCDFLHVATLPLLSLCHLRLHVGGY